MYFRAVGAGREVFSRKRQHRGVVGAVGATGAAKWNTGVPDAGPWETREHPRRGDRRDRRVFCGREGSPGGDQEDLRPHPAPVGTKWHQDQLGKCEGLAAGESAAALRKELAAHIKAASNSLFDSEETPADLLQLVVGEFCNIRRVHNMVLGEKTQVRGQQHGRNNMGQQSSTSMYNNVVHACGGLLQSPRHHTSAALSQHPIVYLCIC